MAKFGWFALQLSIIGFSVWANISEPAKIGEPPNIAGGLFAGVLFAFAATIAIVIVREQWLLWTRKIREWRDGRHPTVPTEPRLIDAERASWGSILGRAIDEARDAEMAEVMASIKRSIDDDAPAIGHHKPAGSMPRARSSSMIASRGAPSLIADRAKSISCDGEA